MNTRKVSGHHAMQGQTEIASNVGAATAVRTIGYYPGVYVELVDNDPTNAWWFVFRPREVSPLYTITVHSTLKTDGRGMVTWNRERGTKRGPQSGMRVLHDCPMVIRQS